MTSLDALEPALLWKHFITLSAIPRASTHEQAAAAYVESVAVAGRLQFSRDGAGNLLVTKPATSGCEAFAPVVLQAHLDMVPQRTKDSRHDFLNDPLCLVREGDWVRAEGTTLGADNGMGVAAALALLESTELRHGPLSALFTVEEEIGLRGAAKVGPDFLQGDFLINLDGDNPEELIIGCAGALDLRVELPCRRQLVPIGWTARKITLGGLAGGHSGADIHRGRANAILAMARLLSRLGDDLDWRLCGFRGGDARNAIPREAEVVLAAPPHVIAQLDARLGRGTVILRNEYQHTDPMLALQSAEISCPAECVDLPSLQRLLDFLGACPNGAFRFSDIQPGVVETSSNLGILSLGETGDAQVHLLARSSTDSAKEAVGAAISGLVRLAGGAVVVHGNYPGWQPSGSSRLVPLFTAALESRTGRVPRIAVVHGGLECGLLKAAQPRLDCISFGPVILDMHSPEERVQISSVSVFWDALVQVLANIPRMNVG